MATVIANLKWFKFKIKKLSLHIKYHDNYVERLAWYEHHSNSTKLGLELLAIAVENHIHQHCGVLD